jgi:hypothetical protein
MVRQHLLEVRVAVQEAVEDLLLANLEVVAFQSAEYRASHGLEVLHFVPQCLDTLLEWHAAL